MIFIQIHFYPWNTGYFSHQNLYMQSIAEAIPKNVLKSNSMWEWQQNMSVFLIKYCLSGISVEVNTQIGQIKRKIWKLCS